MRAHPEFADLDHSARAEAVGRETGIAGWKFRVGDYGPTYDYPPQPSDWSSPWCFETLECGGFCHLAPSHGGDHLCAGDTDGSGSCPA